MKTSIVLYGLLVALLAGAAIVIVRRLMSQKKADTAGTTTLPPVVVSSSSSSGGGGSGGGSGGGGTVTLPNPATNLTANAVAGVTNLAWNAPVSGPAPTGYKVMRRSGVAAFVQIGSTVAAPAVVYADTTGVAGTAYDYHIIATISGVGDASASNTASATAVAAAAGFIITGVGQNVTGASPQQSYHTVTAPARVINLDATPDGSYTGSATLKNPGGTALHTETFAAPGLNISPGGYPAVYFNPTNPVWGVTAAGTYTMDITLNIGGTNYTRSTPIVITAGDLGQTGGGGGGGGGGGLVGEPSDPNPNVEMIIDPYTIKGRFKITGGSGTYNVAVRKSGTTIATGTATYGTYAEFTLKRFYNQEDLAGQTLTWEFEKAGNVTSVNFFTPEAVHREYVPEITFDGAGNAEYPNQKDRKLMLRYTKPFDSGRIKLEDVGENLGMTPFYYINGSVRRTAATTWNNSALSARLVPALRQLNIVKFLIGTNFANINDPAQNLFGGGTGVNGGKADVWFRTAANQNI